MHYYSRILRVVKEEGIYALFHKTIKYTLIRIVPYFDIRFDKKHGVDTCGIQIHDENSDIPSSEKEQSIRYEPSPVKAIRQILQKIPVDYSKYTFIDYGSGKGRILLLASEYPYKNIIGLELSHNLSVIAENNIKNWKNTKQKCFNIKSICVNATDYILPNEPLVLYFFTPFSPSVMMKVIDNIKNSISRNPRNVHIVYYGSSDELLTLFTELHFPQQNIYSKRLLSAPGKYNAYLFSHLVTADTNILHS